MAQNNNRTPWFLLVIIFLLAGTLIWYIFVYSKPVIGTDIDAYVDSNGKCVSRQGIEMGMCCGVYNITTSQVDWVDCNNLIVQKPAAQALFTFEGGSQLTMDVVMFTVKVTNDGNVPAAVKIDDVQVSSTPSGLNGITEIRDAFMRLSGQWSPMLAVGGGYYEYSMSSSYPIKLSMPTFLMADGTYSTTLSIKCRKTATDSVGFACGSRTVNMVVKQESVMITMDIRTS